MRINDILTETQTEEGIASAIGSGVGAVGAVAGGVHGAWDRFKQGYQGGRGAVSGAGGGYSKQQAQQALTLRQQADALDGGTSAQTTATPIQNVPRSRQPQRASRAAGGQGQPYVAPPSNTQSTSASTTPPTPASTLQPTPSQVRQSRQAQAAQAINSPSSAPASSTTDAPNTAGSGAFSNMANTVAGPNTMANAPVSVRNVARPVSQPAAPQSSFTTPPPQVRQTVPTPPPARNINGLPIRNMEEGKVRSSFLDMNI